MDILQDTFAIRRRHDPQVRLHFVSPDLGEVFGLDPVFHDIPLDLES